MGYVAWWARVGWDKKEMGKEELFTKGSALRKTVDRSEWGEEWKGGQVEVDVRVKDGKGEGGELYGEEG